MEVLFVLIFALAFSAAGYGFRGLIHREIKVVAEELKAEFIKLELAVRTKL